MSEFLTVKHIFWFLFFTDTNLGYTDLLSKNHLRNSRIIHDKNTKGIKTVAVVLYGIKIHLNELIASWEMKKTEIVQFVTTAFKSILQQAKLQSAGVKCGKIRKM